jgi:hypothetical protein
MASDRSGGEAGRTARERADRSGVEDQGRERGMMQADLSPPRSDSFEASAAPTTSRAILTAFGSHLRPSIWFGLQFGMLHCCVK